MSKRNSTEVREKGHAEPTLDELMPVQVGLRLLPDVLKNVDAEAQRLGLGRNPFIQLVLIQRYDPTTLAVSSSQATPS